MYIKNGTTYHSTPKSNPFDSVQVEIGDSKQIGFYPQAKIMRWDNEVNVSVRLVHDETAPIIKQVKDNINWRGDKVEANFYSVVDGHEFEVILKERPINNVVSFTVAEKELDWLYQPPLTEEFKIGDKHQTGKKIVFVSDTEVIGEDGTVLVYRPENVVNSYAIYYKDTPPNIEGGKEYKAGKAFHIYRPEIIDANGNKVWAQLVYKDGTLNIIIDEHWLDNAVYPVLVDPTFGYTTDGATQDTSASNFVNVQKSTDTPASNGTLTSISISGKISSSTPVLNPALYAHNATPANMVNLAHQDTSGTAFAVAYSWVTTNLSYNSLTAGAQYWIGHFTNVGTYAYHYDAGGTGQWKAGSTWPDPWGSGGTASTQKQSVYATYTLSSSAIPIFLDHRKRRG